MLRMLRTLVASCLMWWGVIDAPHHFLEMGRALCPDFLSLFEGIDYDANSVGFLCCDDHTVFKPIPALVRDSGVDQNVEEPDVYSWLSSNCAFNDMCYCSVDIHIEIALETERGSRSWTKTIVSTNCCMANVPRYTCVCMRIIVYKIVRYMSMYRVRYRVRYRCRVWYRVRHGVRYRIRYKVKYRVSYRVRYRAVSYTHLTLPTTPYV